MAPKRKAVNSLAGQTAKRVASRPGTPMSTATSDDEVVEEEEEIMLPEDETVTRLIDKYSIETYSGLARNTTRDAVSGLFHSRDHSNLPLKPDHADRPLWIDPDKARIIMERFSPRFREASDFLVNIAEPVSRTSTIHEYTLTTHSLFAAVSVGLTTEDILRDLESFSKTPLPISIREFIKASTKSFGKVRLVLKDTKYWVESNDPAVLRQLLRDPELSTHRIADVTTEAAPTMGSLVISGTKMAAGAQQAAQQPNQQQAQSPTGQKPEGQNAIVNAAQMRNALLDEEDDDQPDQVHSFQIAAESVEKVSQRCRAIDLPLTEEYDFRNDEHNANLLIDLKPAAQIRYYQEKALHKMFGNGRARSGIIVLPCGAGKTLVGITAACTVKKGCIVLCTSAMSVVQWKAEFIKWSNVNPQDIVTFTAQEKETFTGTTGILVTTYSMLTAAGNRSHDAKKMLGFIEDREWGLMILDEVHVVPANMFKKVTVKVKAHSKLGLTATLLREDDKIQDLNFLIGPKLYEANWQELSDQGHIARVQCAEVWCPMTTEFYSEYLKTPLPNKRMLLFTMNPRKFQACQFLIRYHEKRGDKIIVFSDNVYALQSYAKRMGMPFIYGATSQTERMQILENFQFNDAISTIFLSKIGDTSLDLPEATCLIQISSHYGSRRQEAQRLGRILRAKRRNDEGFNAFFYSLVSKDTTEMYYSSKRQAFLVDQGYAFKVITHLSGLNEMEGLAFNTPQERRELLSEVLLQNEEAAAEEKIDDRDQMWSGNNRRRGFVRRTAGMLSDLSGGQDMTYIELNKQRRTKDLKNKSGNKLMKAIRRTNERKKETASQFQ